MYDLLDQMCSGCQGGCCEECVSSMKANMAVRKRHSSSSMLLDAMPIISEIVEPVMAQFSVLEPVAAPVSLLQAV